MFKIVDNIYSVGVLNPNMRIFDIVMRTEYGTSYNSYLVRGTKKIALIDGCHERFTKQFFDNIKQIVPLNKIDYLIVNHCEPDHTGALKELITQIPNIQIYCSQASGVFLKEITNLPIQPHIVKDGESLSLGNKTLKFINAPFLHWPDSMFTAIEEDKVIFTCDFLGAHYCEPTMLDSSVAYLEAYKQAMYYYYDVIFSPFKKYVNDGLDKLSQFDYQFVCPSHGPILTRNGLYRYVFESYRTWSKIESIQSRIPVFYASAYGYTKQIARAIKEGIQSVNKSIVVDTYDANIIDQSTLNQLINTSMAFCLGSPTLNKNAVPPITKLLTSIDVICNQQKPVLIFGSYGWSGEAQKILMNIAKDLNLRLYEKNIQIRFAPSSSQLNEAKQIASDFARSVLAKK